MKVQRIGLSIYSFGYATGFLRDERQEAAAPVVSIDTLPDMAVASGLGAIEFPIDRYFGEDLPRAEDYMTAVQDRGLRVTVDLERFDPAYVTALLPVLSRRGLRAARIKLFGFYGGNRYREADFDAQLRGYIADLQTLLPALRGAGVRLLIENHQDLGADDLLRIIGETSADGIGITWDVGNSLAVLDTPASFLRKAGGFIGNVHLKDYRLVRCAEGFYLVRCALGEGVVDFGTLLPELERHSGPIPMAIELGAQHARRADVFLPAYWAAYPSTPVDQRLEFLTFLEQRMERTDAWQSVWERQLPGAAIIESEMAELRRSVAHLGQLPMGDAEPTTSINAATPRRTGQAMAI